MEKKLIETLQFFVFFCNDCIKYFNGVCQLCEVNEQQKTILQNELYEIGFKINKIHHKSLDYDKPKTNPTVFTTKYGAMAIFELYYFNQVKKVSIMLYNELTEYTLKYGFNKAIRSLLNTKYNEINDFKDYQCLNEMIEFKTVINLVNDLLNNNDDKTEPIAPETIEPEPPIGKITAGQKYYLLEKLGLFENGLLQGNKIKIEDKQLLVSKLLGVNIRTARAFFNKDEKYIFDPNKKNEIDNLLKKIPKNKG